VRNLPKKTAQKAVKSKAKSAPPRARTPKVRKPVAVKRLIEKGKRQPDEAGRPRAAGKTLPARVTAHPALPRVAKLPPPSTARASGTRLRAGAVAAKAESAVPAEPPLTRAEVAEFREMLLQKRAQILGDVSTLQDEALNKNRRDAAGDLSSMPIHMADLGTDNYEQEFTLGLIESERAVLQEIEEALDRIRDGTYGLCIATGKPIGKARLRAKPWARYCYEFALAQEKGQARGL